MTREQARRNVDNNYARPVLQRLSALHPLTAVEIELVRKPVSGRNSALAGDQLIGEGASSARFLLAGWAAYQSRRPNGRRQILRLLLPGDTFGEYVQLRPPYCEVVALTNVVTASGAAAMHAAASGEAMGLARAFALAARQHDLQLAAAITRLGAMTAYERLVHLLIELADRSSVAGLGDVDSFPLPLTQEILADTLGLSIVHVNRTLQQLRRERLIEFQSGAAVLLQRTTLNRIAGFEAKSKTVDQGLTPVRTTE